LNILHFRYTGIGECDVKLRLASAAAAAAVAVSPSAAASVSSAALGISGAVTVTVTMKRNMTLRDVFIHTSTQIDSATGGRPHALPMDIREPVLFHQLMSAELASSGFQHLVHATVQRGEGEHSHQSPTRSAASRRSSISSAAAYSARYDWPTLLAPGQADPRDRVAAHLACIVSELARMVGDDSAGGLDQPLHVLQFLPAEERAKLLGVWNGLPECDRVDRSDQLLQELFEETAARHPQRTAIECFAPEHRFMTYEAMSRRTNQLAHWLRDNGVGVGSFVGMWLPRGMEVYVALIAILKAGASYVPIDPEYPSDRVSYILEDCHAPVLISTSDLLAEHSDFVLPPACQKIEYDRVDALLEAQDATPLTREHTGQTNRDGCYVIYTSGSTGRPKGCQLEHRSVVNLVRAERILFGCTPEDRVYQGFSIAFDASVEEVWLAFASGGALVAATPDMLHAGPALPSMLVAQRITIVSTVPTLLSMMEDTIPQVRILISGGEAVQKDIIKRWQPGRRFVNTYGPTEARSGSTFFD